MQLFLATNTGVWQIEQQNGRWQTIRQRLVDKQITSIVARAGRIIAGSTDGIFSSDDEGDSWRETSVGLTVRHVRWLAVDPENQTHFFAGTEPAALFGSKDGGQRWQERPEVAALRDKFGWWLPYSPEAGCVRGFAFHGQRGYAAVEVGGALRSDDGGASWTLAPGSSGRAEFVQPAPGFVHADVHSVTTHPTSPDIVFAPTSGGFFGSVDGGANWQLLYAHCYARAVWVDPTNSARLILGPAQNSSGLDGRIEVSMDGGGSWTKTAVSWPRNMVERFKPLGNHLFAVLANGELLCTPLPTPQTDLTMLTWLQLTPEIRQINDIAASF